MALKRINKVRQPSISLAALASPQCSAVLGTVSYKKNMAVKHVRGSIKFACVQAFLVCLGLSTLTVVFHYWHRLALKRTRLASWLTLAVTINVTGSVCASKWIEGKEAA